MSRLLWFSTLLSQVQQVELLQLLLFPFIFFPSVNTIHVTGHWNTAGSQLKIVAKFGFQQLHHLDRERSQGFIFGNITSANFKEGERGILLAVPQNRITDFYSDSVYGQSCDSMLRKISGRLFEPRCFPNGTDDIMRWIPCTSGKLCENKPQDEVHIEFFIPYPLWGFSHFAERHELEQVIVGYQMILRMRQLDTPQYYYLLLVGCTLDVNCTWVSLSENINVTYSLWLTNGNPMTINKDLFSYQFSFDEQDTVVIYFAALIMYLTLSVFEWKAVMVGKRIRKISSKHKLLCIILGAKIIGLFLQLLNIIVFAYDGRGLAFARFSGEFLRLFAVCMLYLLLILLSRGWSVNDIGRSALSGTIIIIWIFLTSLHYFFFLANFFFVVDALHDIDIFKSWPGYGMLLIRMCQALWFLAEIRYTIARERDEEKAVFIAYFGAGFLVWFVYLSVLGVIVSFISVLWRFKVILAITTFANFAAVSSLVHLFWPTGSYSRFFILGDSMRRRLDSLNSAELRDMEYLLRDTDSDTDSVILDIHSI